MLVLVPKCELKLIEWKIKSSICGRSSAAPPPLVISRTCQLIAQGCQLGIWSSVRQRSHGFPAFTWQGFCLACARRWHPTATGEVGMGPLDWHNLKTHQGVTAAGFYRFAAVPCLFSSNNCGDCEERGALSSPGDGGLVLGYALTSPGSGKPAVYFVSSVKWLCSLFSCSCKSRSLRFLFFFFF